MNASKPAAAKRQAMTLKLANGFGAVRNIVPVTVGAQIVGDMHMHRRSGWKGGSSYQFHPNEHGQALGFGGAFGSSVRALLRSLGEAQS